GRLGSMEGLLPQPLEGPLVRRLIEQGIRDSRVLAAFGRVPRRFFVPDDAQLFSEGDHPLEIGYGQTISQPYIVAAMTEALQLEGNERVLEVGTGSGYQTAILCELLPLASIVRTIEIVPELSWRGQRTLKDLGYENVEFRVADRSNGWPEAAPALRNREPRRLTGVRDVRRYAARRSVPRRPARDADRRSGDDGAGTGRSGRPDRTDPRHGTYAPGRLR